MGGIFDSEVASIIRNEQQRQQHTLSLIASENFVSPAVLQAMGSVFTNKYSEGYPDKRYYGGNRYVDDIERLAQERAKKLFGAEHVNVQPYSGSPANLAVYGAFLQPGDRLMGLQLAHGGHLTHGHQVSFSGKFYDVVHYGVDEQTHRLDYDAIRKIAREKQPKIIIAGATAYPRTIDFKQFHDIAQEINAISVADISHVAGLVAAGVHPSPFPFTDIVTTTTHKTLRGPRGAMIMCKEQFAKAIDRAVFPGLQGGPHNHTTAAMAVALGEAVQPSFQMYAKQILTNAQMLAEELMSHGIPLVTDGTDNHLILADLTSLGISGKEAEEALERAGIVVNKNMIPYDKRNPLDPSGIRLGTPGVTTRGMKESEMKQIAEWISTIIKNKENIDLQHKTREEVQELCRQFPVYQNNEPW